MTIMRHRLARRYVVRVSPDGEGLRLTVPRGASLAGGFAFAARQADWIAREMDRQRERHAPWVTDRARGSAASSCRSPCAGSRATFGARSGCAALAQATTCGTAIEARLRGLAADELPQRCQALAREAGVRVVDVSVRNQRSRWGACSPGRVITLNWRLDADAAVGEPTT